MGIKIDTIHNKFFRKKIPESLFKENYYKSIDNGVLISLEQQDRRKNSIERKVYVETKFLPDFAFDTVNEMINLYNIEKSSLDFIVVASKYPDFRSPFTASILQDKLSLKNNILAQDIVGGDDLFVKTMLFCEGLVKTGVYKEGLIVFYDELYEIKKFKDRRIKDYYEDICSVMHVRHSGSSGIIGINFWSENYRARYYLLDENGQSDETQFFYMPGTDAENYIFTIRADSITETLQKFDKTINDIKHFFINSNSKILIDKISEKNFIDKSKITYLHEEKTYLAKFFPFQINTMLNKQELKSGDLILLSSYGFGLTFGDMILKI